MLCFFLEFSFIYFWSYLHVLDVFLYLISCQAALVFLPNPTQIIPNPSQGQLKKHLGNMIIQRSSGEGARTDAYNACRALLEWFQQPFGNPAGAKRLLKPGFLATSRAQMSKNAT